MSVQVKGSGTIGGLDEGLNIVGVVTATSFDGNITGGSVGIGTDNPSQLLHLAADSAHKIILIRGGAAPSDLIFGN